MPPGCCDLKRAFGTFLTLDIAQITMEIIDRVCVTPDRAGQDLRAFEMIDQGDEAGCGKDFKVPGPKRLGPIGLRLPWQPARHRQPW